MLGGVKSLGIGGVVPCSVMVIVRTSVTKMSSPVNRSLTGINLLSFFSGLVAYSVAATNLLSWLSTTAFSEVVVLPSAVTVHF